MTRTSIVAAVKRTFVISAFNFAVFPFLMSGSATAAQISDAGGIITVRGELNNGDHITFDRVAQKYSKGAVFFDSPGGSLAAGIAIGESIRLKGFATAVGTNSSCASSCALAWLGGARRFVSSSSKLGFHSAYRMDGTTPREAGMGNAVVGAYLTRLGLPLRAVMYITTASPQEMTWLTPEDGRDVGIDFLVGEPERKEATSQKTAAAQSHKTKPAPVQKVTTAEPEFPINALWSLTDINGQAPPSGASLMIDGQLRGSGSSGCNTWSATIYPIKGQKLAMGPVMQTKKTCHPVVMAFELEYLTILHSGPTWNTERDTLTVNGATGTLVFLKSP